MANTVIALKKSATPSAVPGSLANGELAINFADGKLFYKASNGTVVQFGTSGGGNSFGTVNANNTLVVADSAGAVLSLVADNNITIVGDAVNDKVTIGLSNDVGISSNGWANTVAAGANAWTNTSVAVAFNAANTSQYTANLAFDKANTGTSGGYYQGNNGDKTPSNYGDIFRSHANTLSANVTIYSGNNSLAAGPITIQSGKIFTIQTGARVVVI